MNQRDRQILLVEDNMDDAELAIRALRRAGLACPVDLVCDGEAALDYFVARWDDLGSLLPFLVLMDIQLPKVNGLQVLDAMRKHTRTRLLPVVVMSSSDAQEDIASAYALGANSYVHKPIEFTRYSDAVQQIGRYWGSLNERLE